MLFFFLLVKTLHLSPSLFSVHALSTLRGFFSWYCKPRPWVLLCPLLCPCTMHTLGALKTKPKRIKLIKYEPYWTQWYGVRENLSPHFNIYLFFVLSRFYVAACHYYPSLCTSLSMIGVIHVWSFCAVWVPTFLILFVSESSKRGSLAFFIVDRVNRGLRCMATFVPTLLSAYRQATDSVGLFMWMNQIHLAKGGPRMESLVYFPVHNLYQLTRSGRWFRFNQTELVAVPDCQLDQLS